MIALEQVEKTYASGEGRQALSGCPLPWGGVLGHRGPQRREKSTLLRLMALLEEPTRGRVVLDGALPKAPQGKGPTADRHRLSGLPFALRRTVAQNAALPLQMQRLPRQEIAQRVEESLKQAGIAHKAGAYRPAFRRTAAAGGHRPGLCQKPRLLLCDEPTSALDPRRRGDPGAFAPDQCGRRDHGGDHHDMNAAWALCPHTALLRRKLTPDGPDGPGAGGEPSSPLHRWKGGFVMEALAEFFHEYAPMLWQGLGETCLMTFRGLTLLLCPGPALGVLLTLTAPAGCTGARLHALLGTITVWAGRCPSSS